MTAALRLITIPISHFCEKARWALDRSGLAYTEEAHLQVFHYLPTLRHGRTRTVPMLVYPDGVLTDSTDILHWVDARLPEDRRLFPADPLARAEVTRLEDHFDTALGPAGRLWMYHHLLDGAPELAPKYGCTGVPGWQRALVRAALPVMTRVIKRVLTVTPQAAMASREQAQRVLDEVATRVADGRAYLVGERLTAADVTFAALCAPLLMTPGYGVPLPAIDELPQDFAREVMAFRAHPAGRFALDLYSRHRR